MPYFQVDLKPALIRVMRRIWGAVTHHVGFAIILRKITIKNGIIVAHGPPKSHNLCDNIGRMVKFKFLGTSAGEQYPGFWCRCPNCLKSRILGGKNIRKNSCALLMPDCLIDLPAEVFMQAERYGIQLLDGRYLLVTHSDKDHLYPYWLRWRYLKKETTLPPPLDAVGPRFSEIGKLIVCGNKTVCGLLAEEMSTIPGLELDDYKVELRTVEPFQEIRLGDVLVKALRANHGGKEDALNYIIQKGGKTVLYALDTGWFLPETYKAMRAFIYDLVIVEATFGDGSASDGHFNFRLLRKARKLFEDDGLLGKDGIFCATHFCPHFSPPHDVVAPKLAQEGIVAAYDGMELEV